MRNKIKVMLILSLCLIMSLSGCSNSDSDWIAKYKDQKVNAGVYIRYLIEEYHNLYVKDLMGEMKDPEEETDVQGASKESENKTKKKVSVLKKLIDGKTGLEWLINESKERVATDISINNKFKELGLELDKETADYVEHNLSAQWETLNEQQQYEEKGVSQDSILATLLTELKKKEIFNAYYGEGGSKEVTISDIKSYLKDEYNKVKYFHFELYGQSDEEKETKKELYTEFLNRAKSGEDFDKLIKEFDDREYNEKDGDEISSDDKSGYDHETDDEDDTISIFKKGLPRDFSSEAVKVIEEAKFNEVTGFEGNNELIVFIKKDPSDSEDYIEENKEVLLNEMKKEEFEEEIKTWINKDEIQYNDKAIERYTPSRLKLDRQR